MKLQKSSMALCLIGMMSVASAAGVQATHNLNLVQAPSYQHTGKSLLMVNQVPTASTKSSAVAGSSRSSHGTKANPTTAGLRHGDRGEEVRALQEKLSMHGFSTNGVDGIYGQGTVAAVKSFQRNKQLPETGIIDSKTKAQIQALPGFPTKYKQKFTVEASAYSAYDPGNGGYTASGNRLRRGLIAVDPRVIPLGTRVYIEGYGYAVADDIGGAIQGNVIDVAMDSHQEAIQFGRQNVVIYIL